jgi:hypothetical protein
MGVPTPPLIVEAFGTGAGGSYINNPIPVPSQIGITPGAASYTDGFPPLTMTDLDAGGIPPFGQDMNGILFAVTANIAAIAAGQFYPYNATLVAAIGGYDVGAILANADGLGFWLNITADNTSDPDTGGDGWYSLPTIGTTAVAQASGTLTLTAQEAVYPYILIEGALTGNLNVIFPNKPGQQWIVANSCTGAHTVTCKTAAGTGIIVPATGPSAPTSIYCDGTNIQNTGVSTAGLAPIASPALTGVPTAPTASTGTNTTQIATTAFANAAAAAATVGLAPLASPTLSGVPTAPTAAFGTDNAQIASTAFVQNAIAPNSSYGANWHRKNPDGSITQGGVFNCVNGTVAVSFPVSFPTACRSLVWSAYYQTDLGYFDGAPSTTGFSFTNGNAGAISWIAEGN